MFIYCYFCFQVSLPPSGAFGQGGSVSWNWKIHGNTDDRWGNICVPCFLRSSSSSQWWCVPPVHFFFFFLMQALCINSQFSRSSQISKVMEHFTAWNAAQSFSDNGLAISQPFFGLGLELLCGDGWDGDGDCWKNLFSKWLNRGLISLSSGFPRCRLQS